MQLQEGSSASRSNAEIHDRTGLYISILALALAAIALGLWLNQSQAVEARVSAAVANAKTDMQQRIADAKADMQQQISDAKAMAHASDTNSRIAIDNVQQLQVQLAAKGIKVTIN
jgi:HAMP domain-containing protein